MHLLQALQERCRAVGVGLHFGARIDPAVLDARFPDADIIVAADGINSPIREQFKAEFKPTLAIKSNRFCWMGSTPPDAGVQLLLPRDAARRDLRPYLPVRARPLDLGLRDGRGLLAGHSFSEDDEAGSRDRLAGIFAAELRGTRCC